jgi:hypothetical protein
MVPGKVAKMWKLMLVLLLTNRCAYVLSCFLVVSFGMRAKQMIWFKGVLTPPPLVMV